MAEASDSFTVYDGSELTVLERPAAAGDPLVMRFRLVDGCGAPPPHVHPQSRETFEVEEGSLELLDDDGWTELRAGESLTVAPGERHTYRNRSGAPVLVRNTHDPHHDFEPYIRTVAAITHQHQAVEPRSPATAAKFALLLSQHSDLIRLTDMPLRAAMPVLALAARALRVSLPVPHR